jgi:2-isopropylmalate synthase
LAKSLCPDVEFSPEDATRTDHGFLYHVLDAVVEAGATTVNIPDTVGYSMPEEFGELIRGIRQRVTDHVTISAHCHNDLGLAVANSLAAIAAGARQVECTINGIGERAGNASLEEIAMAMRVRPDRYPYESGVVAEQLFPSSQLLSELTGSTVQANKAITGRNAFAHEAGIHQDGMLKNPLTYEIMTPQSVGVPDSRLVLGKHSGRHALGLRCEQLGFQFDRRQLDEIYRRFVVLADKIKRVEEHHLLDLIQQEMNQEVSGVQGRILLGATAVAAGPGYFHRSSPVPRAAEHNLPLHPAVDHPTEQEDYLWGV